MQLLRRLHRCSRAFVFLAPVCSSWVWINMATSKRSRRFPLGDQGHGPTAAGNLMVSRLA